MRIPVNDVLGSQDNIDLLMQIKDMPQDFYDSHIVKLIDFMWEQHGWKVICFNLIYILYPISLTLILSIPEDVFYNRFIGLFIAILLLLIEIQ